jgi:hypothetical protein
MKSVYTFNYNYTEENQESDIPNHDITHQVDGSADVTDLIESFHRFLLACGFNIPASYYLDLVKEDSNNTRADLSHPEIDEE